MSSNYNTLYLDNIDNVVKKSFDSFIEKNKICYPNLNRNILEKWNFEENLKEEKIINDFENEDFIKSLPNIFELNENSKPTLVKALLSIQFISENQLYVCSFYNNKIKKYETNKYYEPLNLENDDEENNDYTYSTGNKILCDRLSLSCVKIKGLNPIISNEFSYNKNNNDKVIVLDYTNKYTKINQNILVIGPGYLIDRNYLIHSWKIIPNYLSNKFEKLYSSLSIINSQELIYIYLKKILLDIFDNDSLVSDYIILFLFSQVFYRNNFKLIATLPLNIILDKKDSLSNEKIEKFHNLLKSICLSITQINITIKELNLKRYYPKFDVEKEILEEGDLQLIDKSFVLLNEINMGEGKLEEIGVKNVQTIKDIIESQKIFYEYPYNNVEILHNIQLITFSNGNNSIFKSLFLNSIPIKKFDKNNEDEIMSEDNLIEKIFIYINYIRTNPKFINNFKISDEISAQIQKNYLEKNKKFNPDEFDLILNMSRLYAISNGRNELIFSDYEYVYLLEKERRERLKK